MKVLRRNTAPRYKRQEGITSYLLASLRTSDANHLTTTLVEIEPGILAGINTILANNLILEGIQSGVIKELQGYNKIRTEVSYGKENSRIDILLEADVSTECYIEVKNVTLVENEIAYFPDAVSKRGSKHLRELEGVVKKGKRGVIVYCVQRKDAKAVSPADHIDTEYGITLRNAVAAGVEAIAYQADITLKNIVISNSLPVKYY